MSKKLKFNFKNIINLKPFDENEDNSRDDFTGSKTRSFFIYLAFFCSIAGISAVFM